MWRSSTSFVRDSMGGLFRMKRTGRCSRPSSARNGMIEGMRAQALVFLLVGFAIGFAGIYTWEKQRAPAVVRATPLAVDPNVPTDLSAANGASEPAPPPLNMERVKELTSKIKQNPKDFD